MTMSYKPKLSLKCYVLRINGMKYGLSTRTDCFVDEYNEMLN